MQLPFAVIPLIHFTSDRKRMASFVNPSWLRTVAWTVAAVIVGLNVWLVYSIVGEWIVNAGEWRSLVILLTAVISTGLVGLLSWVVFEPVLPAFLQRRGRDTSVALPEGVAMNLGTPVYERILVPLDHTNRDRAAIAHAAALARTYGAALHLLHVEEGVTSQIYGPLAETAEVEAGQQYLDNIAEVLRAEGFKVETHMAHSDAPASEIVRIAQGIRPDLIIMGAHGHKGLRDLIYGNTINAVRHELAFPILVVRGEKEP
jgi:manganese transport protein